MGGEVERTSEIKGEGEDTQRRGQNKGKEKNNPLYKKKMTTSL